MERKFQRQFKPGDTVIIYPAHEEAPAWKTTVVEDDGGERVRVKSDMTGSAERHVNRQHVHKYQGA